MDDQTIRGDLNGVEFPMYAPPPMKDLHGPELPWPTLERIISPKVLLSTNLHLLSVSLFPRCLKPGSTRTEGGMCNETDGDVLQRFLFTRLRIR
jgi:hypothetical protein